MLLLFFFSFCCRFAFLFCVVLPVQLSFGGTSRRSVCALYTVFRFSTRNQNRTDFTINGERRRVFDVRSQPLPKISVFVCGKALNLFSTCEKNCNFAHFGCALNAFVTMPFLYCTTWVTFTCRVDLLMNKYRSVVVDFRQVERLNEFTVTYLNPDDCEGL